MGVSACCYPKRYCAVEVAVASISPCSAGATTRGGQANCPGAQPLMFGIPRRHPPVPNDLDRARLLRPSPSGNGQSRFLMGKARPPWLNTLYPPGFAGPWQEPLSPSGPDAPASADPRASDPRSRRACPGPSCLPFFELAAPPGARISPYQAALHVDAERFPLTQALCGPQ